MTLCTERIRTLDDVRAILDGNEVADITHRDRGTAYAFIERVLVRFRYHFGLSRAGKGLVREFLAKATGYSDSQTDPVDPAAAPHWPHPRPPAASSVAALRHGLHDRRRAGAGRGERGLRPALGTGDEEDPVAPVPCLRRQALRTPGRDLERPHLQPASSPDVSDCPHHIPHDTGRPVADRPAAQAPAGGPSVLRARRHCPQRRPRLREGVRTPRGLNGRSHGTADSAVSRSECVRPGAGSVESHLRRRHVDPVAARLDGVARADVRVLAWDAGARGP